MDIDELIKKINENRTSMLRLHTNAGQAIDLPPGTRAFQDATDMVFIHWPPNDPANPFKVSRSMVISGVNVASMEWLNQKAG